MAQFYTLEEAARVLGMSADELKLKAQHREVRAFLDGGSWRFRVADVDELARRRGMGSDPDLSLSDLDLEIPAGSGSGSSGDIDLSEFQLGVAEPKSKTPPGESHATDDDILLDDMNLPPAAESSSSSTIIGMKPKGKQPSDSDVRLVPEGTTHKDASDSDVRLAPPPRKGKFPSDSDVTIVNDSQGSSDEVGAFDDPGATTLRKSPLIGSSGEVKVGDTGDDSDFELTPSSVIDALQPESGSDFELTALDASDEFETTPARSPSDSDVTASEPANSGINLGKPSDSGINLSGVGGFDFSSAESIELAPLDEDAPLGPPKKPSTPYKPAGKKQDASSETALPIKGSALDPSATALPIKSKKKARRTSSRTPTLRSTPSIAARTTARSSLRRRAISTSTKGSRGLRSSRSTRTRSTRTRPPRWGQPAWPTTTDSATRAKARPARPTAPGATSSPTTRPRPRRPPRRPPPPGPQRARRPSPPARPTSSGAGCGFRCWAWPPC